MSNWVEVEIPRNASDPNSIIIGYAIFDLDLPQPDGGTFLDPNYHNFVALVSTYDPRDTDFSGGVSFLESLAARLVPDNLAETRFTHEAYEYLHQTTVDNTGFQQLANGALISMGADLLLDGVTDVYSQPAFGIAKSLVGLFFQQIGLPALGALIDTQTNGEYVRQFFIKPEHEGLVESYMGSFDQDPTPTDFDRDFVSETNATYSSGTNYVFVAPNGNNDVVAIASDGDDFLLGAGGNDNLSGGFGTDVLLGRAGNDTLNAGVGEDYVNGGAGSDTIYADAGRDTIYGGAGQDYLHYNRVDLTAGETLTLDLTTGAAFTLSDGTEISGIEEMQLSLAGGTHDISMVVDAGANSTISIAADADIDHFRADFSAFSEGVDWRHSSTNDSYVANITTQGNDHLIAAWNFERYTVIGGSAGDRLNGGDYNDHLEGRAGNDTLFGSSGNDVLSGGAGDDSLDGGGGIDTADYSSETAAIVASLRNGTSTGSSAGSNTLQSIENIVGTAFEDVIKGNGKANILNGGSSADTLKGLSGKDVLFGGNGSDKLYGGAEGDSLFGGNLNDKLYGGDGWDILIGANGSDKLFGGKGKDQLSGGAGNDTLEGNGGKDVFIFEDGFGQDVIVDFNATNDGEDINLSAVTGITDFADLVADHMQQVGDDVLISDGGNTVTLLDVDIADLDNADFIF